MGVLYTAAVAEEGGVRVLLHCSGSGRMWSGSTATLLWLLQRVVWEYCYTAVVAAEGGVGVLLHCCGSGRGRYGSTATLFW